MEVVDEVVFPKDFLNRIVSVLQSTCVRVTVQSRFSISIQPRVTMLVVLTDRWDIFDLIGATIL